MWHYGISQSQHCNNDDDDNVTCVSMWLEFTLWVSLMSRYMWYMRRKCGNKEGDPNWTHMLLRALRYKGERVCDITEDDFTEVRVSTRFKIYFTWAFKQTCTSRISTSTKLLPMGKFRQHKYLYRDTWWPTLLILNLLQGCNKNMPRWRFSMSLSFENGLPSKLH